MPAALDNLRDIHLPAAVPWWPLAPGWWLLALLGVIMLLYVLYRLRGALRRYHVYRAALRDLERIEAGSDARTDTVALIAALSIWLRRVCISLGSAEQVAGLSGEAWLAWLDRELPERPFASGPGRILALGPYRSHLPAAAAVEAEALPALCRTWLRTQRRLAR